MHTKMKLEVVDMARKKKPRALTAEGYKRRHVANAAPTELKKPKARKTATKKSPARPAKRKTVKKK